MLFKYTLSHGAPTHERVTTLIMIALENAKNYIFSHKNVQNMLKIEEMCHLLDIDEAKYEKAIDKYT